ncbi:MAG: hypothetical protein P4L22_04855 [Candidatus Babeliales bacterium]|nr:hypothetical protein [Candidatus Babeliales bacterium]
MKLIIRMGLLVLCIFNAHAELLIVKHGENGVLPLDVSDELNKADSRCIIKIPMANG